MDLNNLEEEKKPGQIQHERYKRRIAREAAQKPKNSQLEFSFAKFIGQSRFTDIASPYLSGWAGWTEYGLRKEFDTPYCYRIQAGECSTDFVEEIFNSPLDDDTVENLMINLLNHKLAAGGFNESERELESIIRSYIPKEYKSPLLEDKYETQKD